MTQPNSSCTLVTEDGRVKAGWSASTMASRECIMVHRGEPPDPGGRYHPSGYEVLPLASPPQGGSGGVFLFRKSCDSQVPAYLLCFPGPSAGSGGRAMPAGDYVP